MLPAPNRAAAQQEEDDRWLAPIDTLHGIIDPVTDEDYFYFEGRQGMTASIYMAGYGPLDSYLILLGPGERHVASDNDTGVYRDAAMDVVLPEDGIYTLIARNFRGLTTGRYNLSLLLYYK